ncbi:uncharacterized protein M6B38_171975 [Iris pallida]|uniref:Uncharacterized protein n=1 Tax=Iris pallida TaxID=29817 RepID=A0AAX6ET72_IRIPA|nr:uncharacterized protein M6B38_171975 [Iris pallida]
MIAFGLVIASPTNHFLCIFLLYLN